MQLKTRALRISTNMHALCKSSCMFNSVTKQGHCDHHAAYHGQICCTQSVPWGIQHAYINNEDMAPAKCTCTYLKSSLVIVCKRFLWSTIYTLQFIWGYHSKHTETHPGRPLGKTDAKTALETVPQLWRKNGWTRCCKWYLFLRHSLDLCHYNVVSSIFLDTSPASFFRFSS